MDLTTTWGEKNSKRNGQSADEVTGAPYYSLDSDTTASISLLYTDPYSKQAAYLVPES